MSQPQPRQQHEFPDIQMLQRHIMFKQLQELQRQRQLQQIGDLSQQNYMNQVSVFNKQTSGVQLPPIVNGTPIRDTSQIFSAGNMQLMQRGSSIVDHGFPNGSIFSQGQSQAAMGVLPHQLNMSIYGGSVVGTGNNLNPYSALQGLSNETTSVLTNSNNNQLELPMLQHATFNNSFMSGQSNASSSDSGHVFMPDVASVPKQVFQEKNFFGQVPVQSLDGLLAGNFQQVSALPSKSSMQESCGSREQVSWSALSAPKLPNMGNSQSSCSLDPLEQKILFNTDDTWESNLGEHGNLGMSGFGSALGNSDCMNSFPSVQSGSWSALMQSAVAEASSSDTGLQEEWSGLSFQNPELSTENQPSNYVDSGRQQSNWIDNSLQNASSPSSKPEFLNQSYSMSCTFQGLQQLNHQFPGQKEEIHSDSPKYAGKWLDCSPRQKQPMKESQLVQIASPAKKFWPSQHYEHTEHGTQRLNVDWKSGEVNTEVNEEKSPLNNVTAVPEKSTTEFKQIVDHEINQHVMNSTGADSLGKENYLDSNQSSVGLGLSGKLWLHGTTHLPMVDSLQKPYHQTSQVLSGSEQRHLGQYNNNVSNIIMAPEQVQLPRHPSNFIPRGDNDGPMPSLLDTSPSFHGQSTTADTRKHLLHRFNADGKIVEHGTGTQFNCKEFVQSSEKTQMKASESSFNQPDNSSSTSQSNGIRLGSPSQWIPRSHTSLEPLPMSYNQLQNQNLPLPAASHSPQAMFSGQATTPSLAKEASHVTPANCHNQEFSILETMPVSKLSVVSNVNQQPGQSMLPDIQAQQNQFQLGFHKVSSSLLQPTASTTSSHEHTTRNSEGQHNQSSFREGAEVVDSLQNSHGLDSKQGEQNKNYLPTPSARDLETFGHSLRPLLGHHQNQVQSLMNAESDLNKMSGKYMGARNMEKNEVNATQYNLLSPQENKVFSFSSETREDQFNKDFSQTSVQDNSLMVMLGRANQTVSANIASNKVEEGRNSLQMAPPWLKHHGNSKNGQILSMLAAKNTLQQLAVGKTLDNLQMSSSISRANSSDASKGSNIWPTTSTVSVGGTQLPNSYELPLNVSDQNLAIRKLKKRKLGLFDSLPWHKEVTQGSLKCPNISMAELEWCLASNRINQKVENEALLVEELAPMHRAKRRLTKTTQIMQQIFRPAPAVIVSADAFSNCDSVVYFVARLALGDACNMAHDFHRQFTAGDMSSDKVESPGTLHGTDFLKTMENFICRAKGLEADFIRLEKRASILDLKVESQELEKFSIINRFARFHNRGHSGAVDTSSGATPAVLKSAPQRYVIAFPMPKTVPEGVNCLSL
nr:Serine-rich adhesin for platelets like [Ipomoea batatas]